MPFAPSRSHLSLATPLTLALTVGLGWAAFDAYAMTGLDPMFWRAWALAAAAACVVAFVVAPFAVLLKLGWHHPRWGGRVRTAIAANPPRWAARCCVSLGGLCAIAAGTFIAQSTAHRFFGSDMVRQLATAVGAPTVVIVVAALGWWLSAAIETRFNDLSSPRVLALICSFVGLAIAVGSVIALPIIAPSVWEQLTPISYLALPVISLGALIAVFWDGSMRSLAITGLLGAITLVLGGLHLATPTPDELRRGLEMRPSGTATVMNFVPDRELGDSSRHGHYGPDDTARCFPDADPLLAHEIGDVGDDAPDIIFITADALRWDHTTLGGYEYETTPHIADHGQQAAIFEQAYSPASNTRQAFRGFFTGIYPSLIEAPPTPGAPWATSFSDGQQTMADYLSSAGYQTIALSSRDRAFPRQHGALKGFEVIDESSIPIELDQGHSVSYKVDRIIAHLSEPDEERPQFVWTHLMEIHQPYPAGPNPRSFDTGRYSRYNSAIHFVDGELKRLLDFARGPTRIDNTVVILTADHGQAFKEHGNRLHGSTTYQEEIHVPLMVWGPTVEPNRFQTPVVGVDILPTLLGWLNLEVPEMMCGDDLSDAIEGQAAPPDTPAYIENIPDETRDYFGVSFIEGNEKLLLFPSREIAELYELDSDPEERHNLAPKSPERLTQRLNALREFYSARGMDPDFYHLDAMFPDEK